MRFDVILYNCGDEQTGGNAYEICHPDGTKTRLTRVPDSVENREDVTWTDSNGVAWRYSLRGKVFFAMARSARFTSRR